MADNVFVGPFVEIQKGVVIGKRTKVQSHSFVCELVSIGEDCFIGHGAMFINDTFADGGPAGGDNSKWKSPKSVIMCHWAAMRRLCLSALCDHVVIGAGSVNERYCRAGHLCR